MKINSIRFKISVLYTAVLGVILIVFSSLLYLSLKWTLYDDLDNELGVKAEEISRAITAYMDIIGNSAENFMFAAERVIKKTGGNPESYKILETEKEWQQRADKLDIERDNIYFISPDGKMLINTSDLTESNFKFLLKGVKDRSFKESCFNVKFESRNLRVISRPFLYNGERYIIQVASSLKPVIEILRERLIFIVITIPIILLVSSFIGQLFAVKILEPVKYVTEAAKNITHKDLSARVEVKHVDDEMKYLVNTFNEMIDRLEKSFNHISEFSSHVTHELKTPLTIIRGESELALKKEQTTKEYRRVIMENLNEVIRMFKIIQDLLLLSKLEYRTGIFKFEQFDIEEFLREIYDQSRLIASQRNIFVSFNSPGRRAVMAGDKVHLRRLFFNIVQNAIKFTPKDGRITLTISYKNQNVSISISDTGIGIPKENQDKIFNKFFHTEGIMPEAEADHGSGLGLNISLAIAKIHNGNIEVTSEYGKGSTFIVVLPVV